MKMRRKKRASWGILMLPFILVVLIVWIEFAYYKGQWDANPPPKSILTEQKADLVSKDFPVKSLFSQNIYLLKRSDKDTLLEIKSDKKIHPASMTKIMTILLGVEGMEDMNEQVRLPTDFLSLYEANASMAGFSPGEWVTAADILYGAMLPSGADACLGIVDYVAGSESSFVELMNQRSQDIGMTNTHFTNADGLHDPKHYSTVKDIALLLDYALDNPTFYEIFTTQNYRTKSNKTHPDGIQLHSTLFDVVERTNFEGGEILGGKTGYTEEAGLCLASLGEKYDEYYILVTAHAPGNHQTEQYHFEDALNVYENYLK